MALVNRQVFVVGILAVAACALTIAARLDGTALQYPIFVIAIALIVCTGLLWEDGRP